ncbi:MAG: hypothetical protein QJR02_01760 [Sinobacteraceae bacterium]|nr:hypothetical protein [Nevskiaceae bacterium]
MQVTATLTVKITCLAQGAYCSIVDTRHGHHALDVLLPVGKGAATGLEERAAEFREKAERYLRYAQLCEAAAARV